jgi:hypothetical protein
MSKQYFENCLTVSGSGEGKSSLYIGLEPELNHPHFTLFCSAVHALLEQYKFSYAVILATHSEYPVVEE